MASIEDRIYAAGYLDGEGCFEIVGQPHRASTRVKLMNSHKATVVWLSELFGGTFKDVGVMSVKPMYGWSVSGEESYHLCTTLLPFLKEKKPQAQCIIDFRDLGMFSRYNQPSEDVLEKREVLMKESTRLKYAHY